MYWSVSLGIIWNKGKGAQIEKEHNPILKIGWSA